MSLLLTGSTPATHRWKPPRGLKEGAHRSPGTLEAKAEDGELPGSLATDLYPASPHRCWPPLGPLILHPLSPHHGSSLLMAASVVCLHHSVRHLMLCLVHCQCSDVWDW